VSIGKLPLIYLLFTNHAGFTVVLTYFTEKQLHLTVE